MKVRGRTSLGAPLAQHVLIAGPTASGKSALALRLAESIGGEIVNADALQLYRDLRLLTARPSPAEEARVPHHLFGVVDAAEGWSVGRWLTAATQVLSDLESRGRRAVIVGGTGLYFSALTRGLANLPAVPQEVREASRRAFDRLGEDAFRAELARRDPEAEDRIAAGDRQRLTRAFEVHEATGRALTSWQATTAPVLAADRFRAVAIEPDRAGLYARCDARLIAMVEAGALEEVRELMARELDPALPAMKAVGVRELGRRLAGELSLPEAVALAQQETRRYAKRQLTWLRNQSPDWPRLAALEPEAQWRQLMAQTPALTLG